MLFFWQEGPQETVFFSIWVSSIIYDQLRWCAIWHGMPKDLVATLVIITASGTRMGCNGLSVVWSRFVSQATFFWGENGFEDVIIKFSSHIFITLRFKKSVSWGIAVNTPPNSRPNFLLKITKVRLLSMKYKIKSILDWYHQFYAWFSFGGNAPRIFLMIFSLFFCSLRVKTKAKDECTSL